MVHREISRRAMSLLELTIVVAILGLLTIAAVTRFGQDSLGNGGAEGFARKLALSLVHLWFTDTYTKEAPNSCTHLNTKQLNTKQHSP